MADHWSVTVERNGEQVVTIESNCLSGREISPEDEEAIRTAARHLLAFIGESSHRANPGLEAAMSRIFQVEYMTRPDEREHIEQFDDFRKACYLAREMSDKHDGDAVVVVLDNMSDGQPEMRATGHILFVFGMVREQVGVLENVTVPR